MSTAFKAFMNQIIDYAGLFPPAKLPMNDAIQNYLKYRNGPDEWMLSRFICLAKRLSELEKYRADFGSRDKPLQISVLGRSGKNREAFISGLEEDLKLVNEFAEGGSVNIDAYEVRLPEEIIEESNPIRISEFLNRAAEMIESQIPIRVTAFYEGAFRDDWIQTVNALIEGISYHNIFVQSRQFDKYSPAGYKLRSGGAEPSMYPTSEQVAHVILTCKRHQIAMKATAGLHHPVRYFNEAERVTMHGFLNVFGAGILAQYHDLNIDQITAIIEDENPQHFVFADSELKWKDFSVTVNQIEEARSQRLISFGSCSFDEPREDLRELGYLNK